MKTKGNKKLKDRNNNKIKRQVSIITVFLWIFLVATMVTIVSQNIKNTNALEHDNVQIYGEISKLNNDDTSNYVNNKPEPPTVDKIVNSEAMVQFICQDNANHNATGSFEENEEIIVGEVIENDGSDGISATTYPWICDIKLNMDFWINLYNEYANSNRWRNHYIIDNDVNLRLYYAKSNDMWTYKTSDVPLKINVIEQPIFGTQSFNSPVVEILCDDESSHNKNYYSFFSNDSFTVLDITKNNGANGISASTYPYVCDIKLNSKFWLDKYGVSNHWIKNNAQNLKLYYNKGDHKWYFYSIPATIIVTHQQPELPTVNSIVSSGEYDIVKFVCKESSDHIRTENSLISDSFMEIGEILLNDDSNGVSSSLYPYVCNLKLNSDKWLNYYNNYENDDYGKHWITSNENILKLYYSYDRNAWTYKRADIPIEIEISHVKPPYTVVYTDGVENETIFADQVYEELYGNSKTPKFKGTPTRKGYEFLGWSSTVNEIVEENDSDENGVITYTALWRRVEFTVIYKDGVEDEVIFEDQYFEELIEGSETPKFDGTPTREGYEFAGWSPAVNPIISRDDFDKNGEMIYTATWIKIRIQYTIIYTDGVKNKIVFPDQGYENCLEDSNTPAFVGIPTREGYEFSGWSPTVNPIISREDDIDKDGVITYTATWRNIADYNKTGFYKIKHEYYVKDINGNLILDGKYEADSIIYFLNDGEVIKVGISNEDEIVDIEVEKKPNYNEYTYEYVESSENVVLEVGKTKEITLKYVREEENGIRIKVEKIWEDENNKYGKRPKNVVLQLKNVEEIVAEIEVSEENNWSSEFEVPKYDELGNEIKYTVDEKETSEFYEKRIDGYKVINKYIGEESKDENNNEIKNNIDTSDINIWIYVGIVIVSIVVIIIVIIFVRKNNKKNK